MHVNYGAYSVGYIVFSPHYLNVVTMVRFQNLDAVGCESLI